MTRRPKSRTAASITLHDPANYTARGLRAIETWAKKVLKAVKRYRAAVAR